MQKKPPVLQTAPQLQGAVDNPSRVIVELPQQQFTKVIALIGTLPTSKLGPLVAAARATLARLELSPDIGQAIQPDGTAHGTYDMRSIIEWFDKIGPNDEDAQMQVLSIEASLTIRGL